MRRTERSMMGLIRHAQRQMDYMRAARGTYATPKHWARTRRETITTEIRRAPAVSRVDYGQARLAARWAVADARRSIHPERARRLDREVEATGVSRGDLQAARWDSYQQGRRDAAHRQDPSTLSLLAGAALPAAAYLAVSANLYDNAYNWDEQTPEELAATDDQWHDPVGDIDTTAETAPISSENSLPAGVDEDFDPKEFLPDDMFPTTMQEQLAHLSQSMASGEHRPFDLTPSPAPDLGAGVDAGAGVDL